MLQEVFMQKGLSRRETDVAILVSKGLTNKEVANQLFVTEKTVKFHLTNLYKKMHVKSRTQLIVWAIPHINFENEKPKSDISVPDLPTPAPDDGILPSSKIGNA